MIVDAIVEGSQLPGLWVVVDVLLHLCIRSLVELVIFSLGGDESGIGSIVHFVSGITELGNVVKGLTGLSVVNEFVLGEVIVPANTVVELSGGIVIIPFHLWVVLKEMLKLDELEDTSLIWKG
jgi:hypothetical protein